MSKKNVTFVITNELDQKIEIHAAIKSKQKSEILTEALNEYFAAHSESTKTATTENVNSKNLPRKKSAAAGSSR